MQPHVSRTDASARDDRRPDRRSDAGGRVRPRGRARPGRAAHGDPLRNVRADARRPLRRLPGARRRALRARRLDGGVPARRRDGAREGEAARPARPMTRRGRIALCAVGLAGLAALLVWGVVGLEPFGHYPGPYGTLLNAAEPDERHAANVVAAVVFDYRGFDTLGEELILFCAVMGLAFLL